MDRTQRKIYQMSFKIAFLESRADEFENLFSRIMGHAFPGDFQPARIHGKLGDLKCDGYRKSDKTVFQCYGPETTNLAEWLRKIDEDFNGAAGEWGERMERWVFVHNRVDGPPAHVKRKLLDLDAENPSIEVTHIGYSELHDIVMELSLIKLEDLFGLVPSEQTIIDLDFEALYPVLSRIQEVMDIDKQIKTPAIIEEIPRPSALKIKANELSATNEFLLRYGRRGEPLVEEFFNNSPNTELVEIIAQEFTNRYQKLRDTGRSADEILTEFRKMAGGLGGNSSREAASLAVLSYFFERCDIFEDHSGEGDQT